MRLAISLHLFIIPFVWAHAEPPIPNPRTAQTFLEADNEVFYDDDVKRLVAFPNGRLSSGDLLLTAKRIEYDKNSTTAFAKGDVIFTNGTFRLLAQSFRINLQSGDFQSQQVRAGFYPWVMEGFEISRKNGVITSMDTSFYLLDQDSLEPNLAVSQLTLDQNDSSFSGRGVALRVGDRKLASLPSLSGNLGRNPFRYGLHAGHKDRLGLYLGTRGEFQVSEYLQAEGKLTAYEKRGFFISPTLDWESQREGGSLLGSLETGWIQDQGDEKGTDLRGIQMDESMSYLRFYSINGLSNRWRFAGQVDWDEDSEVFRDFQRDRFQSEQWNEHFGELSYESENWSISTLTRWQANEHEAMTEQTPNLRFDLAPTPFGGTNLYNTLAIEFGGFRKKDDTGAMIGRAKKLDLGYQLQRPFILKKGLTYTPILSYRLLDYSLDGPDAMTSWGEWGNDIHYLLHGDYDLRNETWKINGIRHLLDFSISHRRVTRLDSERSSLIPLIDAPLVDLNLGPVDLLDKLESDGIEPHEVLRIGWGNYLFTEEGGSNRELLGVHFFQDLWVDNESGNDQSRNFHAGLEVHPASWISLRGQAKIDLDAGKTIRNAISADIRDGKVNELNVSYFNYVSFHDQWQFLGTHRMSQRKALHGALRTQGERPKIPFWQIAFEYRPSRSWAWFFALAERKGTSKENETEATVSARLFSF